MKYNIETDVPNLVTNSNQNSVKNFTIRQSTINWSANFLIYSQLAKLGFRVKTVRSSVFKCYVMVKICNLEK